jgi:hypothetical protein
MAGTGGDGVDEVLDASEARERASPLEDLERSVEWAELRAELSEKGLEKLRELVRRVGPILMDVGAKAIEGLVEREIERRRRG